MTEIVPGVYLVNRVRGSNVYLLVDNQLALIDTGMPGNAPRILGFIKDLGRDPEELAHIIITHGHIDHAGNAAELRRLTKAKTIAHKDELAPARNGKYTLMLRPERSRGVILRALTHLGIFKPCPIDALLADGEALPYLGGLRVVHTPGHTRGSISLFLEKSKVLFVGDTIINNEDRLSRPLPFGADRYESEQSLMKLTELNFSICCFGHGPPLTSEARRKVTDFAKNYPTTPLWWRITRSWRRLIRFGLRLWRR